MDRAEQGRKRGPDYFGEALADFTHDMASGGAIRHMVNLGYPVGEIQRRLDFPTSRKRVQQTVYEYMLRSGMLLYKLPVSEESLKRVILCRQDRDRLCGQIRCRIRENGEDGSFLACDYGRGEGDTAALFSCLTGRERDYLLGIPWEPGRMYHILNSRMAEIGLQLALEGEMEQEFFFLRTRERVIVPKRQGGTAWES